MARKPQLKVAITGRDDVSKVLTSIGAKTARTLKGMAKHAFSLKGVIAGVLGGAAVRGVFDSMKGATEALTTLRDAAEGVRGIDPQKIAEASAAFQQMGSSREAAVATLRALNSQLEALRGGSGKVAALLDKQIKIAKPEDVKRLQEFRGELLAATDPIEALHLVMRRFSKDPDASIPFLTAAVGRKNANDIVRIMKEGGSAALLLEQIAARGRLGSEVNKAADAADALDDAAERVKDTWEGIKWKALAELAPGAIKSLDTVVAYLSENKEKIAKALELVGAALVKAVEWLVKNIEPLLGKLHDVAVKLGLIDAAPAQSWEEASGRNAGSSKVARAARIAEAILPEPSTAMGSLIGANDYVASLGIPLVSSAANLGADTGRFFQSAGAGAEGMWNDVKGLFRPGSATQPVNVNLNVSAPPGSSVSGEVNGKTVSVHNLGRRTAGAMA